MTAVLNNAHYLFLQHCKLVCCVLYAGSAGIMGRQLEATVHTSLPPRVQGSLRAYVRVCVSAISWEYSVSPPASKLCVGLRWWGEESPGTVFRWGTDGRWTLLQLYIILWIVHTDCMYPYKHTQLSLSLLSHTYTHMYVDTV